MKNHRYTMNVLMLQALLLTGLTMPPVYATAEGIAQSEPAQTETKTSMRSSEKDCANLSTDRFYETLGADYLLQTAHGPLLIHGRQSWQALQPITQRRLWAPYPQPLCPSLKRITVHHTHSIYTIQSLQVFHQTQDDPKADIAYHFFIDRDGKVYEARPMGYIGSHAEADNEQNLGIVLNGDFQESPPPPQQLQALKSLLQGLKNMCPCGFEEGLYTHQERKQARFPDDVSKHTACPGRYLAEPVFDFARELDYGPDQARNYILDEVPE